MTFKLKHLGTAALATVAIATAVGSADATVFNHSATISILPALTMGQTQAMDFGKVLYPTAATETAIITIGSGTGTGTLTYIDSTVFEGQYNVTGSTTNLVSISAADAGGAAGAAFTALVGDYGAAPIADLIAGATAQAAPGAGTVLKVGGTLELTKATVTSDGTINPTIDFTITYD